MIRPLLSNVLLSCGLALAGCRAEPGAAPEAHAAQAAKDDPHASHAGHGAHAGHAKSPPAAGARSAPAHADHAPSRPGPRRPAPSPAAEPAPPPADEDPHRDHRPDAAPPEGLAPFELEPHQARALHLRTVKVEERDFVDRVRTVGVVVPDETRTSHVHVKVRGFLESVRVDFVGRDVKRGQPLASVFSQEVLAAKLEYLTLFEQQKARPAATGAFAETDRRAQRQMLDAARRRLTLWDVPASEIARIEETREVSRTFTLVAPRTGTVLAKQAIEGTYVDPSMELYTVSDLSRVWAMVDVYEAHMPFVRIGQKATLSFGGTDEQREATVSFVYPTLDEATRTMKVRFDLDNRERKLRPGAFLRAELEVDAGRGLAVPRDAVIRTGRRAVVFVVHGLHVEPREVELGPLVGGFYRVQRGLRAGEEVATGAQFLLDSESQLRAAGPAGAPHAH